MDMEDRRETAMEKNEPSDATTRKRIKQAISVPFVWEEIPGTPKRDWKPTAPVKKPVAPPVKFIASVPFQWEEKPGKPLPCFSQQPSGSPLALPLPNISSFPLSPRHFLGSENCWTGMNDQDGDQIEMLESYPASCESEADDSFCSAPSLLANRLVPTVAISNAVPVQQTSFAGLSSGQLQRPASPASETGSSTSSYETGNTNLVGASFLEWLFPLLTPQSNILEKVGSSEKEISPTQTTRQKEDIDCERNYSAALRKPHTLGELIMMSRRRSYQRKAFQMQTQNLSKDFMKKNAVGRWILGSSNFVGRFHRRWTRQLQLKLL
ncbi:uncharacterized protein [Coffea arabica]|uniref:Hydroxyproline-rich glycoprotein family protein n=1 Tax=Coffea arabica TaxID=13443 RepID=A0A6P6VLI7_COFAR|nr:uncharacterized protein LOC113725114 [Coffea arabica]